MDLLKAAPEKYHRLLSGFLPSFIDHLTLLRPIPVFLFLCFSLSVWLTHLPLKFLRKIPHTQSANFTSYFYTHVADYSCWQFFCSYISFTHSYKNKLLPNPWIYCNLPKSCTFMNERKWWSRVRRWIINCLTKWIVIFFFKPYKFFTLYNYSFSTHFINTGHAT